MKKSIELTAKEILLQLIREDIEKYPFSLNWEHVMELLDISKPTVYKKLKAGEIPGANYIEGVGWRINRNIFLTYLYCGYNKQAK